MNCPSRNDPEALVNSDYNQNPPPLALEKNSDMNGMANRRTQRDHRLQEEERLDDRIGSIQVNITEGGKNPWLRRRSSAGVNKRVVEDIESLRSRENSESNSSASSGAKRSRTAILVDRARALRRTFVKFGGFIGPGFMVAVAYIDPGNYATDVAAGASYKFQLLCIVLLSNIIAIFLQSLSIKLGSVTGMNLAENCKAHCPKWLNIILYIFAEAAIIATDIAEVIGTAIALNLLLHIPLVAGCAISIVDVLIILLFYRPSGTMRGVRIFELFVALLVLAVVICFCIELSLISVPNVRELFRGFLPDSALVQSEGLYQACGILGATVMPHSLYLGSGIVQPRLYEWDLAHGNVTPPPMPTSASSTSLDTVHSTTPSTTSGIGEQDSHTTPLTKSNLPTYRPTLAAIKSCLTYSIVELTISLFTFALFVNSAILIVAGASLSGTADAASADLFGIYHLLASTLAPAAATIFALALLLSGTSAGIVCTIAGQMVSEGQLNWSVKPWVRRLITRSISITPSIIIAGAVGQQGLSKALEGSQVALSVILPVTSAPLIWFTMRGKFMMVDDVASEDGESVMDNTKAHAEASTSSKAINSVVEMEDMSPTKPSAQVQAKEAGQAVSNVTVAEGAATATTSRRQVSRKVNMKNHWVTSTFAVAMWALIVFMNVASWVMMGLGTGN